MSGTQSSAVTPGNWSIQTINGMQYMVLLPANYDPSVKYATVLYLHQLDMGSYGPSTLQNEINAWFDTTSFRTDHPSIIVAPLLDFSRRRGWGFGVTRRGMISNNNQNRSRKTSA